MKKYILLLSVVLGGCAVYPADPYYPQPVYAAPAPVYVAPAPVYIAPTFGFGYRYYGGGRYHHHGYRR